MWCKSAYERYFNKSLCKNLQDIDMNKTGRFGVLECIWSGDLFPQVEKNLILRKRPLKICIGISKKCFKTLKPLFLDRMSHPIWFPAVQLLFLNCFHYIFLFFIFLFVYDFQILSLKSTGAQLQSMPK